MVAELAWPQEQVRHHAPPARLLETRHPQVSGPPVEDAPLPEIARQRYRTVQARLASCPDDSSYRLTLQSALITE